MEKSQSIIYVGNFHYPDGNAAGKRVSGVASLLEELGYGLFIIDSHPPNTKIRESDVEPGKVPIYTIPYPQKLTEWLRVLRAYRLTVSHIKKIQQSKNVFAVIMYSSPVLSLYNYLLVLYCRRNGIKVFADCVDWLHVQSHNSVYNLVKRLDDIFQKHIANVACNGVICISEYFEEFYRAKGCNTVVIPPISIPSVSIKTVSADELEAIPTIVYAGRPFRDDMRPGDISALKDRIDLTLLMFSELEAENMEYSLQIYGFERQEIVKHLPHVKNYIDKIGEKIKFHGMTPNKEVVEAIARAHYTVLTRSPRRDTIAGFPLKVSESVSYGTPVIVTDVGDIRRYIVNGVHGFLMPADNLAAQVSVLKNAIRQTKTKVSEMKSNCVTNNCFSAKKYSNELSEFIRG